MRQPIAIQKDINREIMYLGADTLNDNIFYFIWSNY